MFTEGVQRQRPSGSSILFLKTNEWQRFSNKNIASHFLIALSLTYPGAILSLKDRWNGLRFQDKHRLFTLQMLYLAKLLSLVVYEINRQTSYKITSRHSYACHNTGRCHNCARLLHLASTSTRLKRWSPWHTFLAIWRLVVLLVWILAWVILR